MFPVTPPRKSLGARATSPDRLEKRPIRGNAGVARDTARSCFSAPDKVQPSSFAEPAASPPYASSPAAGASPPFVFLV